MQLCILCILAMYTYISIFTVIYTDMYVYYIIDIFTYLIPPYNFYLASQHPTATHRSLSQDDTANRSNKAWVCWTMGEGVCVCFGLMGFFEPPKMTPFSPPPRICVYIYIHIYICFLVVVWFHISSWGRNETTKRHFQ